MASVDAEGTFFYSWQGSFYNRLVKIHKVLSEASTKHLDSQISQRWEQWRPVIKTFITPLLKHDPHYLGIFCTVADLDTTSEKSELLLKDAHYFGLDARLSESRANIVTSADFLNIFNKLQIKVPANIHDNANMSLLDAFTEHIEYWTSVKRCTFYRAMIDISYFPVLLYHRARSVFTSTPDRKVGFYSPELRIRRLTQYEHSLANSFSRVLALFDSLDGIYTKSTNALEDLPRIVAVFQCMEDILDCPTLNNGHTPTTAHLFHSFNSIVFSLSQFRSRQMYQELEGLLKPSILVRTWLPISTLLLGAQYITSLTVANRHSIAGWFSEARTAIWTFWGAWIKGPMIEMWKTIRYENESHLSLSQANSLQSDLDSLERMVVQFSRDHPKLGYSDDSLLLDQIRSGDLSPILKQYEREMASPFKSFIAGNLVQLILIQVQKTKVDLQLALSAVDRLLKSNELNFAFLAVFPTLAIVYLIFFKIRRLYRDYSGHSRKNSMRDLETCLYRLDVLFDFSLDEEHDSSLLSGCLIVLITRIYNRLVLLESEVTLDPDRIQILYLQWLKDDLKRLFQASDKKTVSDRMWIVFSRLR